MTFDDAVTQLFRAPHADFVNERKRLATELRAAGDKSGAAQLNKFSRPPISAWAVNQLWYDARADFDALLAAARRVREGELAAIAEHKATLAKLVKLAGGLLTAAGNAAADATLRRVEQSLSTIAVNGGFAPDRDGALTEDREPTGFASLGIPTLGAAPIAAVAAPSPTAQASAAEEAVRKQAEDAARALAEAAERARAEIEAHARAEAEAREAARRRRETEEQQQMLRALEAAKARLEQEKQLAAEKPPAGTPRGAASSADVPNDTTEETGQREDAHRPPLRPDDSGEHQPKPADTRAVDDADEELADTHRAEVTRLGGAAHDEDGADDEARRREVAAFDKRRSDADALREAGAGELAAEEARRREIAAFAQRRADADASRAAEEQRRRGRAEADRDGGSDKQRAKEEVERLRGEVARLTGELARAHGALVEAERRLAALD